MGKFDFAVCELGSEKLIIIKTSEGFRHFMDNMEEFFQVIKKTHSMRYVFHRKFWDWEYGAIVLVEDGDDYVLYEAIVTPRGKGDVIVLAPITRAPAQEIREKVFSALRNEKESLKKRTLRSTTHSFFDLIIEGFDREIREIVELLLTRLLYDKIA